MQRVILLSTAVIITGCGFADGDAASMNTSHVRPAIELQSEPAVLAISWNEGSDQLLTGGTGGIAFWDLKTGRSMKTLKTPREIYSLALSGSGELLVSGGMANRCCLWDLSKDAGQLIDLDLERQFATATAFSKDEKQITFVLGSSGTIVIWDLEANRSNRRILTGGRSTSEALTPDGKFVALADIYGDVNVQDVASGEYRCQVNIGKRNALAIALTSDGATVAAGAADGTIRLISNRGKAIRILGQVRKRPKAMSFSANGNYLAVGGGDSTKDPGVLYVFDVISGRAAALDIRTCHGASVTAVEFDSSGNRLASAALDGSIAVWSIDEIKWNAEDKGPKQRAN